MERSPSNVALILGATGIVGGRLLELLTRPDASSCGGGAWKVYGVARRPPFDLLPARDNLHYVQCDILDQEQATAKLAPLRDVTHVFYATWTSRHTEDANCEANGAMLKHVLDVVTRHAPGLKHICLQTGIKHYLGTHFAFDAGSDRFAKVYEEDKPRLPEPQFYYVQEDLLFRAVEGTGVTWSVHRPGLIFGLSPHSFVNASLALAVYASICKHENAPLAFVGTQATWDGHLEASDADLIAEQQIWAATSAGAHARNQAYNVSNGDDVTWRDLWPCVARSFGIEAAPFSGEVVSFAALMRGKGHVWDAIVAEHGLAPSRLQDLEGGWQVLDITFQSLPAGKSSMEKSKRLGFTSSRSTKDSLLYWFEKMRENKLIPKA